MKNLKFRIFDRAKKRFGYIQLNPVTINWPDPGYIDGEPITRNGNPTEIVGYRLNDLDTVQQYTGLKDQEGKEVFIGDICRFDPEPEEEGFFHGIAQVVDTQTGWTWKILRCDNKYGEDFLDGSAFWNDRYHIIGNIYENQELLEVKP